MILDRIAKHMSNLWNNIFLFFCHARRRLFSATCAVTIVPHMHFCVSKFKHHELFCYFITLLIVQLIWTTFLCTRISFKVSSTVHECFQSSCCQLLLLCKYCMMSLSTLLVLNIYNLKQPLYNATIVLNQQNSLFQHIWITDLTEYNLCTPSIFSGSTEYELRHIFHQYLVNSYVLYKYWIIFRINHLLL